MLNFIFVVNINAFIAITTFSQKKVFAFLFFITLIIHFNNLIIIWIINFLTYFRLCNPSSSFFCWNSQVWLSRDQQKNRKYLKCLDNRKLKKNPFDPRPNAYEHNLVPLIIANFPIKFSFLGSCYSTPFILSSFLTLSILII